MLTIPARFNGPPGSANGGYACGLAACLVGGGEAEVTLQSPPPLDRPLAIRRDGDSALISDGETPVMELEPTRVGVDVPAPVSFEEACEASKDYSGFRAHAYATCFVCGPERSDGLGIFPGPVAGRELVAAPWTPPPDVSDELVWAALDCPSGWAIDQFAREGVLLGRLAARIDERPTPDEPHVVLGWPLGADGRKRFAGSAIVSADGRPIARARSTWLVPRPA